MLPYSHTIQLDQVIINNRVFNWTVVVGVVVPTHDSRLAQVLPAVAISNPNKKY